MQIESLYLYVQLVIGIVAIIGIAKSAWSGVLKNLYRAARDIPEIHEKVREIPQVKTCLEDLQTQQNRMETTQEDIKNAVIALAASETNEDVETDLDEVRRRLSDNHSSDFTVGEGD